MARFEKEPSEFVEKLVSLNRVSKTVKVVVSSSLQL